MWFFIGGNRNMKNNNKEKGSVTKKTSKNMKVLFTPEELTALKILLKEYDRAVKRFNNYLKVNKKYETRIQTAEEMRLEAGLCYFALMMDEDLAVMDEDLKDRTVSYYKLLKKALLANNYETDRYVCYTVEDALTKTDARKAVNFRRKLLKDLVKNAESNLYEECK